MADLIPVNVNPCNDGQMTESLTNIVNNYTTINNNASGGTIIARCTLTSDGMSCAPATLAVSNFNPLVTADAAAALVAPTVAIQYLNYATFGSKVGYIAYHPVLDQWEVIDIFHNLKTFLTSAPTPDGLTIHFPNEVASVPTCDNTGTDDITLTLDDPDLGVEVDVIYLIQKDGCEVDYYLTTLRVLGATPSVIPNAAWIYNNSIPVLIDIAQFPDGHIYGRFREVIVPCLGTEYTAILLETERCTSVS